MSQHQDERAGPPHVVLRCGRRADRDRIARLLDGLGASYSEPATCAELTKLLEEDRIDLAVADASCGLPRLDSLLSALATRGREPPPLILLARPRRLPDGLRRVAHQFHVSVVPHPGGADELAAAVRTALTLRDRQRGHRRLRERLARAEAQVEQLRDRADADSRRRTQLLAAISHNLRTPINEIMLFCQVVQGSAASGSGRDGLADAERLASGLLSGVAALRELVDDLLDIARFDLGTLEFRDSVVPLGPFLERTLATARALATGKGLDFRIEVEPPAPALRVDPDMLARIVQNLASNAVKFTDRGEVVVSARADPDGAGGATIEVRDTGRGIAPEAQRDIFDEFAQVDNAARDRSKGTGLGLAICRRLATALGGRIELDSQPGRGSTFRIVLPASTLAHQKVALSASEEGRRAE